MADEKFHMVMNTIVKSHGVSLNDILPKGPDFVSPLIAIMTRVPMLPSFLTCGKNYIKSSIETIRIFLVAWHTERILL